MPWQAWGIPLGTKQWAVRTPPCKLSQTCTKHAAEEDGDSLVDDDDEEDSLVDDGREEGLDRGHEEGVHQGRSELVEGGGGQGARVHSRATCSRNHNSTLRPWLRHAAPHQEAKGAGCKAG